MKIQKRFPSYSGTASPLVLRSLESSLQFRKLHCPSKSIFEKDYLVLHKKLKHREDVLFDRAHSWLQGLPSGQPCLDPSPWQHRPCTSPNSAPQNSSQRHGNQAGDWPIVLSPHFPGAHFPLGVEEQVASPEKAWFAMDCNHMEVQEGSLTGWMYGAFLECNKDVNLSFRTLTNLSLPGYLQETLLPKCL